MTTPTSPNLPTNDLISTKKEYSDLLTQDMTDDEISKSFNIMLPIIKKWQERFVRRANSYSSVEAAMEDLEKFEDELKYELATRLKIYVTVDCLPVLEGKPPVIVVQGPLEDHLIHKYGFDHSKKEFEVQRAYNRGEDYLGATDPRAGETQKRAAETKRSKNKDLQ
jgi:hypothetical protein